MRTQHQANRTSEGGGALLIAVVTVLFLSSLSASMFMVSLARKTEIQTLLTEESALYMAEAGLSEAILEIAVASDRGETVLGALGTAYAPVELKQGGYWCTIQPSGAENFIVTATGIARNANRTIEATVGIVGGSVFDHAIFSGNRSGDPNYELRLSGVGAAADQVTGDIFSGNDILHDDDASILGSLYASGTITGGMGTEGVTRPLPDIQGMSYETNNDYDVASIFAAATWEASVQGGSAWQMPESDPAHIFRKNPDDRGTETSGTPKDDYFLEDPYEAVDGFTAAHSGNQGHVISLAETANGDAADGNDKVYYIDGNLWVHSTIWLETMITATGGARVSFIVKGNVYFSDDIVLDDPTNGGLAIIAIEDENEPDSGNIFFGDPRYGTIARMEAYLYAENDFYDNNLDEFGSASVTLVGAMTAGDAVLIERDFVQTDGSIVHSQLTVEHDARLSAGSVSLPGIPGATRTGIDGWGILMWRETAEQ